MTIELVIQRRERPAQPAGGAPRASMGVGAATNGVSIQVGGALGVAVIGSLLSTRYQDQMTAALAPHHLPHAIENTILGSIGGALDVAARVGGATGHLLAHAARSAFISGADLGLLTAAAVVLAGCILALLTLPAGPRPDTEPVTLPAPEGAVRLPLRSDVMPANRMNRDEFYAAMARHDDAHLRKILWTVYWRGNAQLRERIEDALRPQDQPKAKPKKELPDPADVLDEVTTFVELARDGAYMAGDRRVHHTERSRWRHTFRRLAADALAALAAGDPAPAQQAVAKMVDLACDMKSYDYVHSDDPVEAAKFVVSEAVAALWESVLRHDGFAAFAGRAPEQLIRWEAEYGWTRRGDGQVAEKETPLAVPLARLLATPDMWRTFAESYLEALEVAGRADPKRPRTVYGTFDETSYRRKERTDDLAAWHEMLLDRFAGTPEDELLDRLVASPALAGPGLSFLRARIAERRGDVSPPNCRPVPAS